jgi:hypothetical protein
VYEAFSYVELDMYEALSYVELDMYEAFSYVDMYEAILSHVERLLRSHT